MFADSGWKRYDGAVNPRLTGIVRASYETFSKEELDVLASSHQAVFEHPKNQ